MTAEPPSRLDAVASVPAGRDRVPFAGSVST